MMITHKQRLQAALEGKILDRPACAMWGPHFNLEDRNAKDLAEATIHYQNMYDFDFIKVMPNGLYFTEDFGQKIRPAGHFMDDTWKNTVRYAVNDPHEWAKIKVPDLKKGAFAREIEAVKRICDYFQGDVPVLPTVFSPFIWMGEMTAGYFRQDVIVSHFKYSEKYAKAGLEVVAETNERLMEAFVDAGADGFFLGYQMGMVEKMGKDMFEAYGKKYDIRNIESIRDRTWFNMAHLCNGGRDAADMFLDYPVEAFNWADTHPEHRSMAEMRAVTDKVLVGGLDHNASGYGDDLGTSVRGPNDLAGDDREEIKQRVKARLESAYEAAGNKFVFAGGCGMNNNSVHRFSIVKEVLEEIAEENRGK